MIAGRDETAVWFRAGPNIHAAEIGYEHLDFVVATTYDDRMLWTCKKFSVRATEWTSRNPENLLNWIGAFIVRGIKPVIRVKLAKDPGRCSLAGSYEHEPSTVQFFDDP